MCVSANFDDAAEVQRIAMLSMTHTHVNSTVPSSEMRWRIGRIGCAAESPDAWVAERDGGIEGYVSVVRRENQLNVEEFVASEAAFARERGKQLFEDMLSSVIAQLDAASLEVVYPAPIADGFNAPEINEHGSTMYRINQPAALSDSFDSIPRTPTQSTPTFITRHQVASYLLVYGWILENSITV